MRDAFPEFYPPTADQLKELWEDGIFVFDSNVLLDVYRFSPAASAQLFDIMSVLGDRRWIPHQAALEYQRQWRRVVAKQLSAYETAASKLEPAYDELQKTLNKYKDSAELLKPFHDAFAGIKTTLKEAAQNHAKLVPSEDLHERLTYLFTGRIGPEYPPEQLERVRAEAKKRYADAIPPGYKDKSKDEGDPYGDVVLWFQLIDHAREAKKPLIFVTGDVKEDWWWIEQGKTILPRPELRKEMRDKAELQFYIYSTESLLINARRFLHIEVLDETIAEVRDAQKQSISVDHAAEMARRERMVARYSPDNELVREYLNNIGDVSGSSADRRELTPYEIRNYLRYSIGASSPGESELSRRFAAPGYRNSSTRRVFDADGIPIDISAVYDPNAERGFALRMDRGGDFVYRNTIPAEWYKLSDDELLALYHGIV